MNRIVILIFLFSNQVFCQKTIEKLLKDYNKNTISYITTNELDNKNNILILDAREKEEYNVSHIESAKYIGFNDFNKDRFNALKVNKNTTIVVYCSLGIRSHQIAEKIKKMGYTSIYNLYGGIFQWKNENRKIVNSNEKTTDSIHAFSKEWGVYLRKGIKVYQSRN